MMIISDLAYELDIVGESLVAVILRAVYIPGVQATPPVDVTDPSSPLMTTKLKYSSDRIETDSTILTRYSVRRPTYLANISVGTAPYSLL